MHDVLRQRLMRRIESLPEEQVYQVLDYIEFLESKYSRDLPEEATGLQRFAENLEDRMRKKAMSPATLREAFQLISAADRVLSSVSSAGRQIIDDLGSLADVPDDGSERSGLRRPGRPRERPRPGPEGSGAREAGRPGAPGTPSSGKNDASRRREHGSGSGRDATSGRGEPDAPGDGGSPGPGGRDGSGDARR